VLAVDVNIIYVTIAPSLFSFVSFKTLVYDVWRRMACSHAPAVEYQDEFYMMRLGTNTEWI
jgi:hypothetical protein